MLVISKFSCVGLKDYFRGGYSIVTADIIKSYCTPHQILVFISVLKAKRNTSKKHIHTREVLDIYYSICREHNIKPVYSSIIPPLKMLDLGGFIKLQSNKSGISKITEIGYGNYTSGVLEDLLYNDPDYTKYESFEPATSKFY